MVDGVAPPGGSAAIESACNGTYRTEGYTDSKGRFSFRLGDRNNGVPQDASAGAGLGIGRVSPSGTSGGNASAGERRLDGCELRARLPGYESETISLAGQVLSQSDIGVIFLHRLGPAEGLIVSMTSLAAPKDAQRALQKGREALAKGKREDARKSLEKATRIYPKYAEAWFELGRLQLAQGDLPAARASCEAAIRADAKFVLPYVALAVLQGAAQEWPLVEETTARVIALDPHGFPPMHFYNALAKYYQHDLEGAEKSAREAERLDRNRDIVGSWELLGSILVARRDFAGAAEQYRTYLALAPHAANATEIRTRLDRMERLSARVSSQTQTK
jgi:tetratricopeptide (TPR) repeat protein